MPSLVDKIPILNIPDGPLTAPIQDYIPVIDVVDDIVFFKDGGASMVLESTSLNFGLLSDQEQQAVIAAYAALINSLSFSIQILVRSQKKDITNYLNFLDNAMNKIENPKLLNLMKGYRDFITDTIKKKNVLGKRFFLIIPFSNLELGIVKSFFTITKKKQTRLPFTKDFVIKKAKIVLTPKRDHLIRQASRLGLRLTQLKKEQLIELFYTTYNPPSPPALEKTMLEEVKQKQKSS